MATPDDLAQTVKDVNDRGGRIVAVQADVRDFESLNAALSKGLSEFGRLDIVSANAGIVSSRLAHKLSEESWRDVIDVNLTGAWHTAKVAIPHLITGGNGGSIVLTSSSAGLSGTQNLAHYVAAKHGLVGLMRTLALELAPYSIRVNSLHPTSVNTPMIMNRATYRLFRPDLDNPTQDDASQEFLKLNALPIKWVEPIDVSNALLFLASDDGRFITGTVLPVDGGSAVK
jgi:(+)-trans-carveol dehydrogenase